MKLVAARPLAEAISTAGGVAFEVLDKRLMIRSLPGVFSAGDMLDWEAPMGGYLLTACFTTGRTAGQGAVHWLSMKDERGTWKIDLRSTRKFRSRPLVIGGRNTAGRQ